jgi:hypothetical protein
MSWEHWEYEARCSKCGRRGFVIESSDDWGRTAASYEGFESIAPDPIAVGRKRVSSRDYSPRCSCGSTHIIRGPTVSRS